MSLGGVKVIISGALPTVPSDGENARRFVRHAYGAELVRWALNEGVGPKPGEETHALMAMDLALPAGPILFVSRKMHDQIRESVSS